jgi:hypothetical protein
MMVKEVKIAIILLDFGAGNLPGEAWAGEPFSVEIQACITRLASI